MKIVNLDSLPWTESQSPKGRFHVFRRNLSLSLGGKRDVGEWAGGHPFDLEQFRVPPGAKNFPFHAHSAQWELYFVISGVGLIRTNDGEIPVSTGDSFVFPPGEAHQISNHGEDDLIFFVLADNPRADVIFYPDSGKWGIKPQRKFFTDQTSEYFAGEE